MSETNIAKMFSLKGKVAVITGASRGIGEKIAQVFASAGARVVICSRKKEAVDDAVERITKNGGKALGVQANVASHEDRDNLVNSALEWGNRLDILVNNAGANPRFGGLATLAESELDKVINVNLKASLFLSQLAYNRWMKDHGGVILNVSSIGGYKCSTGINGYNVIKAALNHLTRCLASEWGHQGIRVNALAPGLVRTDFSKALWTNPAFQEMIKSQPLPRIAESDDLAGAALYLASDASAFVTGHILIVDGGNMVKA
jgi:NAD(P)-dependent dehydrogenase (short-subunit alcohol dehydrogenase family)